MNLPERALLVVDTGHGNAAVVVTPQGVGVIDAGTGPALLELLAEINCLDISWMLLSHADQDHIGGAVSLLADPRFTLRKLRVNPDSQKQSVTWDNLAFEASSKTGLDFQPTLTPGLGSEFDLGPTRIEVLAPSSYLATKGAGSRDSSHRRIDTNSLSAVIRVKGKATAVLLPGDLDRIGLDDALSRCVDLSAATLVWPHHGGQIRGGAIDSFVEDLCGAVSPTQVLFSIGRTRFENPRRDVVAGVRRNLAPEARIACTQLSMHCARRVRSRPESPRHLAGLFALGLEASETCAGTIVIDLDSGQISPEPSAHLAFITEYAPDALCRL